MIIEVSINNQTQIIKNVLAASYFFRCLEIPSYNICGLSGICPKCFANKDYKKPCFDYYTVGVQPRKPDGLWVQTTDDNIFFVGKEIDFRRLSIEALND